MSHQLVCPENGHELPVRVRKQIKNAHTVYWFEIFHNDQWHKHPIENKDSIRFLTTTRNKQELDKKRWADIMANRFLRGQLGFEYIQK